MTMMTHYYIEMAGQYPLLWPPWAYLVCVASILGMWLVPPRRDVTILTARDDIIRRRIQAWLAAAWRR